MVERRPLWTFFTHAVLLLGLVVTIFPIYVALVASSHDTTTLIAGVPMTFGTHFFDNYARVILEGTAAPGAAPVGPMLINSAVMALGIAVGKIVISILSAFAVVYFRFPLRMVCFWLIFATLMLPVEVRILPTYEVIADLSMLNTHVGLIVPLIASATATFLFRQFFMTVPNELVEAARIDGAGPLRFFKDVLLPLSRTNMAALFVILFLYGWNQYLWPLLVTTDESMYTIVMGIKRMIAVGDDVVEWNLAMAAAILAMLPPVAVVVIMQRLFVKGLVEVEK
ncbi:sn-glycerol-3-phosphate ABC transporter permease UgpE [Vreelandella salicampi]|uniref:sn-glycerol-3-phosphate transport system permease protein UgpE n=1 Tax=Vreelandella salicampi TaxID=1449798 RepID=A0A7Z0LN92_9GAMM|nr:sn-glycerol-3-phosphate ABC transporter permease UgpE [Halomonas salicampi]NYS62067.1 sn-glycerol-3-phosphate ABC transporter permease UgpE [Halomonas salicampi]